MSASESKLCEKHGSYDASHGAERELKCENCYKQFKTRILLPIHVPWCPECAENYDSCQICKEPLTEY